MLLLSCLMVRTEFGKSKNGNAWAEIEPAESAFSARGCQQGQSVKIMKSTQSKSKTKSIGEMRAEYRFDYSRSRPNRFVDKAGETPLVVVLDPDVAEVFTTPESVNKALRALITAMPGDVKCKVTA